jgi:hypothetical protein
MMNGGSSSGKIASRWLEVCNDSGHTYLAHPGKKLKSNLTQQPHTRIHSAMW